MLLKMTRLVALLEYIIPLSSLFSYVIKCKTKSWTFTSMNMAVFQKVDVSLMNVSYLYVEANFCLVYHVSLLCMISDERDISHQFFSFHHDW
jgi:hypothetical protein